MYIYIYYTYIHIYIYIHIISSKTWKMAEDGLQDEVDEAAKQATDTQQKKAMALSEEVASGYDEHTIWVSGCWKTMGKPWENDGFMGFNQQKWWFNGIYLLVMSKQLLKIAIEIVRFP